MELLGMLIFVVAVALLGWDWARVSTLPRRRDRDSGAGGGALFEPSGDGSPHGHAGDHGVSGHGHGGGGGFDGGHGGHGGGFDGGGGFHGGGHH
ncbi:MAG TPA: hypothetical protein VHO06_23190 [Polyangia bacterium]|nr:hypothetical protein [Polyangia bacterium]